jgi:hypothetical protein
MLPASGCNLITDCRMIRLGILAVFFALAVSFRIGGICVICG